MCALFEFDPCDVLDKDWKRYLIGKKSGKNTCWNIFKVIRLIENRFSSKAGLQNTCTWRLSYKKNVKSPDGEGSHHV